MAWPHQQYQAAGGLYEDFVRIVAMALQAIRHSQGCRSRRVLELRLRLNGRVGRTKRAKAGLSAQAGGWRAIAAAKQTAVFG